MSTIRAHADSAYNPQTVYNEIHRLFMTTKVSHYKTKSLAAHEAFGRTYDSLNSLIDSITEKLVGYSGVDVDALVIGTVNPVEPATLASIIMTTGEKLEAWANSKDYCDIENLAQELSGVGAQLKYLSRFP